MSTSQRLARNQEPLIEKPRIVEPARTVQPSPSADQDDPPVSESKTARAMNSSE